MHTEDELKSTISENENQNEETKPEKAKRYRNFIATNVIDIRTFDKKKFVRLLDRLPHIVKYAFIIHDKDKDDKKKLKKPHYHLVCACDNTYHLSTIANWLNTRPTQIEPVKSTMGNSLLYLTHLNAPDKYQYSDDEVIANFAWKNTRQEAKSKIYADRMYNELMDEILAGRITYYNLYQFFEVNELHKRYLLKWDRDIKSAFRHRMNMLALDPNRNLQTWFINGKSSTGKTTLAKIIAKRKDFKIFVTGSDNDIFDGYAGQECIIIDDCRKDTFKTYNDILKLTDKHTASRFRSRFTNKVLTEVQLLIITSTCTYDELFIEPYKSEEQKQIKRRISTVIHLDGEKAIMEQYNEDEDAFEYISTFKNPVPEYVQKHTAAKKQPNESLKKWVSSQFECTDVSAEAFLKEPIYLESTRQKPKKKRIKSKNH